jgi:chromosome segregation ATPase
MQTRSQAKALAADDQAPVGSSQDTDGLSNGSSSRLKRRRKSETLDVPPGSTASTPAPTPQPLNLDECIAAMKEKESEILRLHEAVSRLEEELRTGDASLKDKTELLQQLQKEITDLHDELKAKSEELEEVRSHIAAASTEDDLAELRERVKIMMGCALDDIEVLIEDKKRLQREFDNYRTKTTIGRLTSSRAATSAFVDALADAMREVRIDKHALLEKALDACK